MDFIKNTSFNSCGDICWPPPPSLLLDELSMDKKRVTDSVYLFSADLVYNVVLLELHTIGISVFTLDVVHNTAI